MPKAYILALPHPAFFLPLSELLCPLFHHPSLAPEVIDIFIAL
jgi:hypothetical protein